MKYTFTRRDNGATVTADPMTGIAAALKGIYPDADSTTTNRIKSLDHYLPDSIQGQVALTRLGLTYTKETK